MRKLVFLSTLLLAGAAAAANSNQTINIQGVLRDATGALQSMAVGLDVNLYSSATSTTPFYTQHFATVGVDNGFFTVELAGSGLSFSGVADAWLGVQVSGDPAELPRQHLDSAPYAFTAGGLDCSGCVTTAMFASTAKVAMAGTADSAKALSCSGCVTGSNIAANTIGAANIAAGSLAHTHAPTVMYGQSAQNINIPGLTQTEGCSACPSGTVVVSGQCQANSASALNLQKSFATTANMWCCDFYNTSNGQLSFFVAANCLSIGTTTLP